MLEAKIIHPPAFYINADGDGNLQCVVRAFNHPADGLTLKFGREQALKFKRVLYLCRTLSVSTTFILGEGVTMQVAYGEMRDPESTKMIPAVIWKIVSDRHPWKELPYLWPLDAIVKIEQYIEDKIAGKIGNVDGGEGKPS